MDARYSIPSVELPPIEDLRQTPSQEKSSAGVWIVALIVAVVVLVLILLVGTAREQERVPSATSPGVGPQPTSHVESANIAVARQDIIAIRQAISRYTMESGGIIPETLEDLITGPPDYQGRWRPLFEDRQVPRDPWGHEYVYEITDPDYGEYMLTCYGRDGEPGGEGLDADLIWPDPDAPFGG